LPTGRPVPESTEKLGVSYRGAKTSTSSVERWVVFKNHDLTPSQAKTEAMAWVENQNKMVYGSYKFVEMSFNNEKMSFQYKVSFTKQEP